MRTTTALLLISLVVLFAGCTSLNSGGEGTPERVIELSRKIEDIFAELKSYRDLVQGICG